MLEQHQVTIRSGTMRLTSTLRSLAVLKQFMRA